MKKNPLVKFLGEFTKQVLEKQDETNEKLDKIKKVLSEEPFNPIGITLQWDKLVSEYKTKKHPVKEKQLKTNKMSINLQAERDRVKIEREEYARVAKSKEHFLELVEMTHLFEDVQDAENFYDNYLEYESREDAKVNGN